MLLLFILLKFIRDMIYCCVIFFLTILNFSLSFYCIVLFNFVIILFFLFNSCVNLFFSTYNKYIFSVNSFLSLLNPIKFVLSSFNILSSVNNNFSDNNKIWCYASTDKALYLSSKSSYTNCKLPNSFLFCCFCSFNFSSYSLTYIYFDLLIY